MKDYENFINNNNIFNTENTSEYGFARTINSKLRDLVNFMDFEASKKEYSCFSREKLAMFFYFSKENKKTYIIFKELDTNNIIAYTTFENYFGNLPESLKELAKNFSRKKI